MAEDTPGIDGEDLDTEGLDVDELKVEDTAPVRRQQVEQRVQEMQAELEVNGRLNGELLRAAGLDISKVSEELLGEIKELGERTFNAQRPRAADGQSTPTPEG